MIGKTRWYRRSSRVALILAALSIVPACSRDTVTPAPSPPPGGAPPPVRLPANGACVPVELEVVVPPGVTPPPAVERPDAQPPSPRAGPVARQALPPPYRLSLRPATGAAEVREGVGLMEPPLALCLPPGEASLELEARGGARSHQFVEVVAPGPVRVRLPAPMR